MPGYATPCHASLAMQATPPPPHAMSPTFPIPLGGVAFPPREDGEDKVKENRRRIMTAKSKTI